MARAASPTPSRSKQWKALGPSWMPAPISPSWLAFSSTSDAMPFWARPRAVASPPMPPPAMRILARSTHDLLVMQPGDLMVRQSQDTRQDLVRMLAQHRGGPRRVALEGAELKRSGGHRIAADARLVEYREHGIAPHMLGARRKLAEALIGRPQGTRLLERGSDLGCGPRGHPRLDHRTELGAGLPAAGVGLEVDALLPLDARESLRKTAGRGQRIDVTVREDADHDVAAVLGPEVAAERAEDLVAEARPVDLVDHGLADVAQCRRRGERHVLQGQHDLLTLSRQPAMPLGRQDRHGAG